MTDAIGRLLLWLYILNLGIAFGAGLYEHRIVVARWLFANADGTRHWDGHAARRDNTGLRFWAFVTTGPLTLLTIANVAAAWRAEGPIRTWWLAAGLAGLGDRLFTFAYFIPTMVGLIREADTPQSIVKATRWMQLNYVRHAFALAAWLCALRTFSLIYAALGGPR